MNRASNIRLVIVLVVAGIVALFFFPSSPSTPLVGFTLELKPAPTHAPIVASDDGRFGIVLRPAEPTSEKLRSVALWVGPSVVPADLAWARTPDGVLAVDTRTVDVVPTSTGAWRLVVGVGRPDALPDIDDLATLAAATSSSARSGDTFLPSIVDQNAHVFVIPLTIEADAR